MPTAASNRWRGVRIYTIGHSTRTFDELVALLRAFDVAVVADIRTIPRSRHNPQFNGDALPAALRRRRLKYVHLPRLGGLRRPGKDATNSAWRNQSFRGYADYMQTDEFAAGLAELRAWAAKGRVALMCAEAVPWRCHRSLVADALMARGAQVEHITGLSRSSPHRMTAFAVVEGARVTYPGERDGGGPLPTPAPFHLEATVRVLQRRPINRVDVWDDGRYRRVLTVAGELVLVEVEDRGTVDAPDLRYVVSHGDVSPAARPQLAAALRKVLGLDVEPAPLLRLTTADRRLRPTGLALRGMRPPRFAEWFEVFANVVPFQQVSLDAGAAVVARLVERFGRSIEHAGRRFHAFPTAPAVAAARLDTLRACGLSARKAEVLRHLAWAIASGELAEATIAGLTTPDALATLGELPGIGPWSAALVLLRGLGRLDVFPPGDVGVARGLRTLTRVAADAPLDVERFGDRRGYLYFCALGGDMLARGLIHAAPPPKRAPGSGRSLRAGTARTSRGRV
ncbi:DUF488 family protein [Nannocystis punicea]|uniref:DUF488 family protein n=1 Tax=Nannocystis punicea TaxID=2995304 RepID=A0ABY7H963_9BACT|nr:DUF488 family protein [Nannocystis poenicansa]WAS95804.1 DUF488 family protein [Nannocystis poenicansa]